MENNIICNWLLYYGSQGSETIVDVQSSPSIKRKLCSSIAYFDCGSTLFDDFPVNSTGFLGLFDYLIKDEGTVMDKMKDNELRSFIDKLMDYEGFSLKHHISIIKCLMKTYVCRLAPWDRIKRALDALGVMTNTTDVTNFSSFRYLQKTLALWLKEAASRGMQRLSKSVKDISSARPSTLVENGCLGTLVLYTMIYYAQTKMIKYIVTSPETESSSNNPTSLSELPSEHCRIVLVAFGDICENKDSIPLTIDGLLSNSMDNVQATLTIALIFHWTFGNSLRNLENLLKSSISDSCDKTPNHRPCHLSLTSSTSKSLQQPAAFFMNSSNNTCSVNILGPVFSRAKVGGRTKVGNVNGSVTAGVEGDTSPEIFLTPTEDEIPTSFTNSHTPPLKLLSYKTTDNILRPIVNKTNSEPISINLKAEFQKKILQKQSLDKLKPKVNIVSANETTWLAQSNKNEIIPIPLTPKKNVKPPEIITSNDSSHSLTKSQMNEIQIQLSLRRKKIEQDKKGQAQQQEKSIETSKQKVFFQALNSKSEVSRRKSLESIDATSPSDTSDGDRRLSLYMSRTEKKQIGSITKLFTKDLSREMVGILENETATCDQSISKEREKKEKVNDVTTLSKIVDIQTLVVENDPEETPNIPSQENHIQNNKVSPIDVFNAILPDESSDCNVGNVVYLSRKNSSPSVSSLSSLSNISSDKNLVTKDEYQKSIELLSTSLTSLQEEIRFLSKQQLSWNRQISQPVNKVEPIVENNKPKSENNSVAETPTNNIVSLTEVTNLSPRFIPETIMLDQDHDHIEYVPEIQVTPVKEDCHFSLRSNDNSPQESCVTHIDSSERISPSSGTPSPDKSDHIIDLNQDSSIEDNEFNNRTHENEDVCVSFTGSITMEDRNEMTSSIESPGAPPVQPLTFVIADDSTNDDAIRRKSELLAKREQRRLMKLEMFRQKREQDRENRLSATNEELLERELKKKLEQEKRDSLLQKYLDRKNEEKTPSLPLTERRSASTTNTPIKTAKSQTPRSNIRTVKQESVENLTLSSPKRNSWFSSMRQTHRVTSSSTSVLNTNGGMGDSVKFGVPLPPQEYMGPKLFGKRKVKTNRSVISNAIAHCCLAGSVNVPLKEAVLKELSEAEGTHFMILFRDPRCQYRSLYIFDLITEDLNLITGNGPKKITHEMVEKFFKYNSGAKQFNPILSTKHLSPAVDAICIQSIYWNTRPTGQVLSGAVSSLSLTRPKKL